MKVRRERVPQQRAERPCLSLVKDWSTHPNFPHLLSAKHYFPLDGGSCKGMNASKRPNPKRRWLQFRLRTLLLMTAACAVVLSLWTAYVAPYRARQRAIAALTELGARVTTETGGPGWVRKLVGEGYFVHGVAVSLNGGRVTDAQMQPLKSLRGIRRRGTAASYGRLVSHL
jgi:hypothetical protein